MYFDRIRAKAEARAAMAGVHPHPMLVTLVYLLLTSGLSAAGTYVIFLLASGSPLRAIQGLVLGSEFFPEELWTGALLLPFLFFSVLMWLFSTVLGAGYTAYAMRLARGQEAGFHDMMDVFAMAGRVLLTVLWQTLCILGWTLAGSVLFTVVVLLLSTMGMFGMILLFPALVGFFAYMLWVALRYSLTYFFLMDEPEAGPRAAVRSSVVYMNGWKWELFKLQFSFLGWQLLSMLTMGVLGLWVTPYSMGAMVNFYDCLTGRWPRAPRQEALDGRTDFWVK